MQRTKKGKGLLIPGSSGRGSERKNGVPRGRAVKEQKLATCSAPGHTALIKKKRNGILLGSSLFSEDDEAAASNNNIRRATGQARKVASVRAQPDDVRDKQRLSRAEHKQR